MCFFLALIGDANKAFKNVSLSNKTGKYNSAKKIKLRYKIRAAKIGENISDTKNVREVLKREISLYNQETLCETLQNLAGMLVKIFLIRPHPHERQKHILNMCTFFKKMHVSGVDEALKDNYLHVKNIPIFYIVCFNDMNNYMSIKNHRKNNNR